MKKKTMIAALLLLLIPLALAGDKEVKKEKKVKKEKAFMGVALKEIKEGKHNKKVVILDVFDDSAADLAGLNSEDFILKINGEEVTDIEEVRRMLKERHPNEDIELFIERGDQKKLIELTLGEEPHEIHVEHIGDGPIKRAFFIGEPRPYVGVQLKTLEGQLAKFFGVDSGILIESVLEDSPAMAAGIQAGDVILSIGGQDVHKSGELLEYLDAQKEGDEVVFRIVRKQEELDIPVILAKGDLGDNQFILHGDKDISIHRWVDENDGEIKIELKTTIEKEN